ncbi:MAG: hypothetical protein ACETVX_03390, partial [bacterium]
PPPAERKIHRDAMRYAINIEFPSKEKEEIDFDRLKKQIANKVLPLLIKNQIEEKEIPYRRTLIGTNNQGFENKSVIISPPEPDSYLRCNSVLKDFFSILKRIS